LWDYFTSDSNPARLLDTDLAAVMKSADPDFDWQRIAFVLEAGVMKHKLRL
jgi:hypothetical protein